MKVFIDTNVLVDFLVNREPWAADAIEIFKLALESVIVLHTSSVSVVNCAFILRSRYNFGDSSEVIIKTLKYLEVLPTTKANLLNALSSTWSDKEDAIQYFTASAAVGMDYIITRDKKGFAQSDIPVLTPYQFIQKHLKK